ncbi:MAG: type I-B CRISPR-associated protein Cas8b1/Cst1 [Chloroflexi bacterium]|nr:type I-B CRISPR-associated protein Cas8b1/Cst1 [Chloroflexota bacterium]
MKLTFTGHPLVDVGAATIAAFAGKSDPAEVAEADLEEVADFIAENYVVNPLKSFLTVAFPNSGFTQPAFEKTPEKRREYAEWVLRGYREDAVRLAEACVFTGQPATAITFRQHVPLLTGEGVINFYPWGYAGLPVSGEALLCIQTFPLGSAKCAGRLLLVHSDNPELTLDFARVFLQENRRVLQLAQQANEKKMREAKYPARTLLIQTLLDIEGKRQDAAEDRQPSSVTAYHLSNSGQSPSLDIYHLPLEMLDFLRQAISAEYRDQWLAITQRAWQLPRPKKKAAAGQEQTAEEDEAPRRNVLFEDIFELPGNARRFLRTYFLRIPKRYAKGKEQRDDPRVTYSLKAEADLVSWKLTKLFLRRVMHMDKDRIQQISNLGDRLAAYIASQNAKDFFRVFYSEGRYDYFRTSLLRADREHARRSGDPLITLEEFYEVFEADEEGILQADRWRWGRDLTQIRVVEQLCQNGWLAGHPDAVPETPEIQEPSS